MHSGVITVAHRYFTLYSSLRDTVRCKPVTGGTAGTYQASSCQDVYQASSCQDVSYPRRRSHKHAPGMRVQQNARVKCQWW